MKISIAKAPLQQISDLRVLFLKENNFQFVYNKCHGGWADTYQFMIDGERAGYGALWGATKREDRDSIFEFYVLPRFRNLASQIFAEFKVASGALLVECQSNDLLLSTMLYENSNAVAAEAILFEDHYQTRLNVPGATFHQNARPDSSPQDISGYELVYADEIVASGGFMLNYNMPYADIYMSVTEGHRQMGFGSLLIQELKKEIYAMGRVPSARCSINNPASKATLLKAGFSVCGFLLKGTWPVRAL